MTLPLERVEDTAPRGTGSQDGTALVDPARAAELAGGYGIPVPDQRVCAGPEDAAAAAEAIGYPVVLKAVGPSVVHKSDVGGVRLGLRSADEVRAAAEAVLAEVPGADEVLVQAMADRGTVELIIGAKRDPVFGPVVLLGLGGIWAEVLNDVSVHLAPLTPDDAKRMAASLRSAAILRGVRGGAGVDEDVLAGIVVAVGRLIVEHEDIVEIDINPLICEGARAEAVDLRILRGTSAPATSEPERDPIPAVAALLAPRHVVVIGASRDPSKQGGRLLSYLRKHRFDGTLSVVHPSSPEVMGIRTVSSVAAITPTPDLACIVLPSDAAVDALEECGRAGVTTAIVFSSGFAEIGDAQGAQRQLRIAEISRRYGIRICGPNTAGAVSVPAALCASMGMAFEAGDGELELGSTALVTQSGAIGGSLLSRLREQGIGFSHWVSAGNESDLTLGHYVSWLADDPATETILLFIEAVRDAESFRRGCLRAIANGKAVIAYKAGTSAVGQEALQSHTAALAGDEAVYESAFGSLGVVRVRSLQTLLDVAVVREWQGSPAGRRIGVVSASGGACSVVADEADRAGLQLPPLSAEVRRRVEEAIPSFGRAENPVDVTMQINVRPAMIGEVTSAMLSDDGLDAILVMMTSNADPPAIEVARGVIAAAASSLKPVIVARMGAEELAPESLRMYRDARIPVFPMPERAVAALAAASRAAELSAAQNTGREDVR